MARQSRDDQHSHRHYGQQLTEFVNAPNKTATDAMRVMVLAVAGPTLKHNELRRI